MVLFAEISTMAGIQSDYRNDDKLVANYVRAKVDEFPRIVVQEQLRRAKEKT